MSTPRGHFTFTDPLDLPPIAAADLHAPGRHGVVLEAGAAPRQFVRFAPEYHDDPNGAGLFPGFSDQAIVDPPAFLTASQNVRLVGYRTILTREGLCFDDESRTPEARAAALQRLGSTDPFANEQTGLRGTLQPGLFEFEPGARRQSRLRGSVVVLGSAEPFNFGSFLFRVLPKIHAVRRYGLGALPLLVHLPGPTLRQHLELLDVPAAALRQHDPGRIYALDHAIQPCLRNGHAYLDNETLALVAELRERHGAGASARRLYVSRLNHSKNGVSGRVMVNEAALIDRLLTLGFTIVEPETLSAREQIALFASAAMVVGPSGAGMFNTMFCRPGTRVIDIESEPHWIHAHSCLFASCDLRYAVFEALVDPTDPAPVHRRFSVDIDALCDRIASFGRALSRRTPPPPPPPDPPARPRAGTLDRVTPTHVHGWAHDPAGAQPVTVEVCVDGLPVGRILADLPRGDLAAFGPCAFIFPFPAEVAPVDPGALIGARFADTGLDLVHSPRHPEAALPQLARAG